MTDMRPDRDDERIRAVFRPGQIQPLAPERGHFDSIVTRARHRRQRRVLALAGVVVLAAGAGLGIGMVSHGGPDSLSQRPAGGGAAQTPTPSPSRTLTPTPTAGHLRSASPAPGSRRSPSPAPPSVGPSGLAVGGSVPPGFTTRSVTSVGGGTTYVLGTAPCTSAPCTSMARSTDGGKTWRGVPAPKAELAPTDSKGFQPAGGFVSDLRFGSARDGWAFGGSLYATHDGAATWRQVNLPVDGVVADLATDGSLAYAVVEACNVQGGSCQGATLLSSAVGSDDWRPVPGLQVTFANALPGPSSISLGEADIVSLGGTTFVKSASSGWRRTAPVPCTGGTNLAEVVAAASGSTLFGFCGGAGAGQLYLSTYVSADGGRHWLRRGSDQQALHLTNGGRLSFAASSSAVLVAASGNPDTGGWVQISRDGGATWSTAPLPTSADGWDYVGARSATDLVAISAGGTLYVSGDAGRSWSAERVG